MNFNTEPIKNWFGFTRRERRSTFSLLLIIVIVLGIRYTIPNTKVRAEDISSQLIESVDTLFIAEYDSSTGSSEFKKPMPLKAFVSNEKEASASNVNFSPQQQGRRTFKLVDINSSDTSALVKLPGIGPVLSARIVKYRNFLGGYAKAEQLNEVYGLSEETYELIKNLVTVDSSVITRININSADFKELSHVRYLERYEITAILKYRELKGSISGVSDLIVNKLITYEKAKKVGPYLRFDTLRSPSALTSP